MPLHSLFPFHTYRGLDIRSNLIIRKTSASPGEDMLRETRKTAIGLGLAAAMATSCVYAADGQPLPTPKVNEITQKVWANPDLTEPTKGIRTLRTTSSKKKNFGTFIPESSHLCYLRKRRTSDRYTGYLYPRL